VRRAWLRQVCLKIALPGLPIVIVALINFDKGWVYILAGAWVVLWTFGIARLTRDIRRARRHEIADQAPETSRMPPPSATTR
jgi:hypothetical protein